MRLLVTGASGQVGWELIRSLMPLGEVAALDRRSGDFARPESLREPVRGARPDVIVNAAAYTAVDQAESEEELATTVNGRAVAVLAEEARALGALLVHYSTDYVFDGSKEGAYSEDDPPRAINAYGRSKLAGEVALRERGDAYLIFRTSWVYASRGRNFVNTILRLAGEREELTIVADQIGAPTWARNIADATAQAIRQSTAERREGSFRSGLFHLTANGATSWFGFAEHVLTAAEQYRPAGFARPRARLRAVTSAEYARPAARPKNSRLANGLLAQRFAIRLPDWSQGVSLCVADLRA